VYSNIYCIGYSI